jgi:hypothetical protein
MKLVEYDLETAKFKGFIDINKYYSEEGFNYGGDYVSVRDKDGDYCQHCEHCYPNYFQKDEK